MRKVIDDFVERVAQLARVAALDAVAKAMSEARRTSRAGVSSSKATARGLPRRPARSIEGIKARLVSEIARKPGQRSEEVRSSVGLARPVFQRLLRSLLAERAVRSEGVKRATRYFPGKSKRTRR